MAGLDERAYKMGLVRSYLADKRNDPLLIDVPVLKAHFSNLVEDSGCTGFLRPLLHWDLSDGEKVNIGLLFRQEVQQRVSLLAYSCCAAAAVNKGRGVLP